jgi:hypothetical protein
MHGFYQGLDLLSPRSTTAELWSCGDVLCRARGDMMMVEYTVLILTRAMAATAALPAAAALYMQLAFRYDVYKDAG